MKYSIQKMLVAVVMCIITVTMYGQSSVKLPGRWEGTLELPNAKLRLALVVNEKDAVMYSIDQGNAPIKVSETKFDGKSFEFSMPSVMASYKGELKDEETMSGEFTQGGVPFNLTLKRTADKKDEEQKEYETDLFKSTNVTFKNGDITLAGTLTIPKKGKNHPAAILVTGSGLQNRDEELFGHKPFLRIAEFLSNNGIAVLRYDDRGFAKSTGDTNGTTSDFLTDALKAVEYMRSLPNIDRSSVGIIGHSEGGLIAMMAAADNKVNYIVSLAGPTMAGEDLVLLQSQKILKASGAPDTQIEFATTLNKGVYNILKTQPDNDKAKKEIDTFIEQMGIKSPQKDMLADQLNASVSPWFREFLVANPADYLTTIKCPALLMFGEKDLQVPDKENMEIFNKLMNNKTPKNFTVTSVPGVNHLFQDAQKGTMDEYSNTENVSMNDKTLKLILDWLNKSVK